MQQKAKGKRRTTTGTTVNDKEVQYKAEETGTTSGDSKEEEERHDTGPIT